MVKVAWRIEGDQTKGRIVLDDKGRRKIVFVDRSYRGRFPKDGETTEIEVVRDTKPNDPNSGALIVRPICPPDPDALPQEEARAKMLEMILATGPYMGEAYLEVDLPGWRGTLVGRFPRTHEKSPLSMMWTFRGTEHDHMMIVYGAGSPSYVLITKGVMMMQGRFVVVDWRQAVEDLGQPTAVVEQGVNGDTADVIWEDRQHNRLAAKISKGMVRTIGTTWSNVRLDDEREIVLAQVSLLGGLWTCTEELTTQERFDFQAGTVERARFVDAIPMDVGEQAAALLRPTLHSPDWYKQSLLAGSLDPANSYELAVWTLIEKLKRMLDDPCLCRREIDKHRQYLAEAWNHIVSVSELKPRFGTPATGIGDRMIYGQENPDDVAEVARLTAENEAKMVLVQAEIAALQIAIDKVPLRQGDPDVLMNAWCLAQELDEKIAALLAQMNARQRGSFWYHGILQSARERARFASQSFEGRREVESAFQQLSYARRELKECETYLAQDQIALAQDRLVQF